MKSFLHREIYSHLAAIVVFSFFSIILYFLPDVRGSFDVSGWECATAEVLWEDHSELLEQGVVRMGTQYLRIRVAGGRYAGQILAGVNELRGNMELDKVFSVGDKAEVVLPVSGELVEPVTVRNIYRADVSILLFVLLALLLILFGSWVGLKALLSFVFSCLVIWKVVIPLVLTGFPPVLTVFISIFILTAAIVYLVAGVTKKGMSAFLGSMAGVVTGLLLSAVFTRALHINGATLPFSQQLLGNGYAFLDLGDLFVGSIILAASGAVMDLAMDISSGIEELARHNPNLSGKMLIAAGFRMGRSVVGTMTTTLLLAYSGGFLTLMMVFSIQGNNLWEMLNNPIVAAEVVKTLVGSFSLVTVAPFSALAAGIIFGKKHAKSKQMED